VSAVAPSASVLELHGPAPREHATGRDVEHGDPHGRVGQLRPQVLVLFAHGLGPSRGLVVLRRRLGLHRDSRRRCDDGLGLGRGRTARARHGQDRDRQGTRLRKGSRSGLLQLHRGR
jgi:hypothetical protein